MPITKPDEFKHGNVNLAFVDSDFVRGGIRVVTSASNLTDVTMQSKVDQLKDNATLVYVTNDSVFYRLKSKANITSLTNGWEEIDLTGTDGTDGNTILSGSAAPGAGDGVDGDFFIDTNSNNIYGPKSSGSWPAAVSLVGAAATIAAGTATSVSSGSSPTVTNSGSTSAATFNFEIPSGVAGSDGDGFTGGSYNSSTGVVTFTSDDGLGFATLDLRGNNGLAGDDGKTVLNGSGAPGSGLGSNGDFYIDTTNEDIYGPKTGGNTWGSATSLIGSTGPTGPGYSGGSYSSATGEVTLTGSGGSSNVVTGDLRGEDGEDGDDGSGYSSGAYDSATGVVTFTGTGGNANVTTGDLRGEDGDDATITGATASGLAAGASPTVTTGGTASARTFAFGIPAGAAGVAATATAGTTTTGAEGTSASVSNSGTSSAAVFNFTIPRGATGQQGPSGQGVTIFNSFANTAARDSVAAADRVEGFLAYLKDDDDLYVYTNSSLTDSDWEAATGAANWKLIPKDYTTNAEIDTANLINATSGEYFFNLLDTTGSANEFKKFDINDFFGWMTTQFSQSLVDSGSATTGELNFGSGNALGDMNGDGSVGTADLLLFLAQYGSTASDDNLSGQSLIEISTTPNLLSPAAQTFITLPISNSDVSSSNNGFGTNFIDADDKFGYENGTSLTLNNWSSQESSKLFLGYVGDPLSGSAVDSPIILEGVFSTNDYITLRYVVDIEYSEVGASATSLSAAVAPIVPIESSFGVAQDIEFPPKEISGDIIAAMDSSNTINKIRIKLQILSSNGNTTSIKIKSAAFFLNN
ncbi:hypothetical protein OAA64_01845 [bacterium]|nr:hypothetical protein [bacterium]